MPGTPFMETVIEGCPDSFTDILDPGLPFAGGPQPCPGMTLPLYTIKKRITSGYSQLNGTWLYELYPDPDCEGPPRARNKSPVVRYEDFPFTTRLYDASDTLICETIIPWGFRFHSWGFNHPSTGISNERTPSFYGYPSDPSLCEELGPDYETDPISGLPYTLKPWYEYERWNDSFYLTGTPQVAPVDRVYFSKRCRIVFL